MGFCLPKQFTDKLLKAVGDGSFNPADYASKASSEARRSYVEQFVGKDNALEVNTLMESKLLLKDWQKGMVTAVKKLTGLSEPTRTGLIERIGKMDKLLNPADEKAFYKDITSKRLGVDVSLEDVKKIAELSNKIKQEKAINPNGIAYGRAVLDLHDFMQSQIPNTKNIITNVANVPVTAMTTLDFSAALRQGWGMISTGEFYKSLPKMFKFAFDKGAYRDMQASIIADPLFETAKKSGLRVSALADKLSGREEAYMTTLLNKVPGVAASERAYVGFLNTLRFARFKNLIKAAELKGENVTEGSQATKDIANVVNDFTGSGNIGKGDRYAGSVPALNASFFSPRKISATINMLNPERYLNPAISATARQAALRQLIGSVAITAGVLSLAKLAGNKVETDPRSSDFGKIVSGKTRFEVTGGNATYAVLVARLLQNSTKSTTTGRISNFGTKFGQSSRADVTIKFTRNKLSPIASLVADWLYGSDSIGNPFNIKTEVLNRITPLIIQDVNTLLKTDKSNVLSGVLGDMFGIGVQSY